MPILSSWRRANLIEIVAPRHRAVVVQDLDDDGRRLEAGEPREVAAGFRVPRARQHAAGLRHQREDVAGLAQVARLRRRRDGRLDRARTVVRRDARRHAFGRFDRDREVRGLANVGVADHQRQPQLLAARARQRQADQPAPVFRHEVDVFGAHLRGRHDEVAFVLALLVVEDHDHLAGADRPRRCPSVVFSWRPGAIGGRVRSHVSSGRRDRLRRRRRFERGVRDNAPACRPQY